MSDPYPAAPTELDELRSQLYRLSQLLVNLETRMEKLEYLEKRVAKVEEALPEHPSGLSIDQRLSLINESIDTLETAVHRHLPRDDND